jgi:Tol biopolymer transport system component
LYRCPSAAGGKYGAAENLGDSINTATNEFEPWIAPDQSYLIFMGGGRPDSRGGFDLYVTYPRGKGWSRPENLGDAINSKGNEYSPHVSPDGEYFFWTSNRSFVDEPLERPYQYPELLARLRRTRNGLGDLYQIDLSALRLKRK